MTENTSGNKIDTSGNKIDTSGNKVDSSVNKGLRALAIVIAVLICWYLISDRLTPFTSQARVNGFVVGIAPKVAGLVTKVAVGNNVSVARDDLLFAIDESDYQIALARAQSELEKARRQVQAGDAGVEAARAQLKAALANEDKSRKDYERLQRLFTQDPGTISERRLEISEASLEGAIAKVEAARADIQRAIESMGGESEETNAFLLAAESAVTKAELDLANTRVRAPRSGVITDLKTEVGQFAAVGNPVMTLVASGDIWIDADFTENNLGNLQVGSPVEIVFDVLPGSVFDGEISSIGLGVAAGKANQPGALPKIDNNRDWLRQSQRFPVQIVIATNGIDDRELRQLRIGAQASVVAYGDAPAPVRWFAALGIRISSLLTYAY